MIAVGSLVVFVLREYSSVLNINYARSEILVSCLVYIDQLLFTIKLVFVASLLKQTALRRKGRDWLAQNQNNVSRVERNVVSVS